MRRVVLGVSLGLALSGCGRGGSSAAEEASRSTAPGLLSRDDEIDNEPLIAWLKGRIDANPGAGGRERLVSIYTRRGQMRGRLDDFQRCIEYASQEIALEHTAGGFEARARCEASLHRFADADRDLAAAARHFDPSPEDGLALRGDVALALGRYDAALDDYRKAQRDSSPANMARLANLDVELGDTRSADALFDAAEKLVAGRDHVFESWLQVQRALRLLESGALDDALARLSRARKLDPKNVLAERHAAQVLALVGRETEARATYETLILATDDPEYMSRLALLKRRAGDAAGADSLVAEAKARYRADLAAFPDAVAQHYGQFLLDQGIDAREAVDILATNAAARPSAASWVPLAWAQLAAGDAASARSTIAKALATPVKTGRLYWTAARVADATGDGKRAAELRAKALALNPRVADLLPR